MKITATKTTMPQRNKYGKSAAAKIERRRTLQQRRARRRNRGNGGSRIQIHGKFSDGNCGSGKNRVDASLEGSMATSPNARCHSLRPKTPFELAWYGRRSANDAIRFCDSHDENDPEFEWKEDNEDHGQDGLDSRTSTGKDSIQIDGKKMAETVFGSLNAVSAKKLKTRYRGRNQIDGPKTRLEIVSQPMRQDGTGCTGIINVGSYSEKEKSFASATSFLDDPAPGYTTETLEAVSACNPAQSPNSKSSQHQDGHKVVDATKESGEERGTKSIGRRRSAGEHGREDLRMKDSQGIAVQSVSKGSDISGLRPCAKSTFDDDEDKEGKEGCRLEGLSSHKLQVRGETKNIRSNLRSAGGKRRSIDRTSDHAEAGKSERAQRGKLNRVKRWTLEESTCKGKESESKEHEFGEGGKDNNIELNGDKTTGHSDAGCLAVRETPYPPLQRLEGRKRLKISPFSMRTLQHKQATLGRGPGEESEESQLESMSASFRCVPERTKRVGKDISSEREENFDEDSEPEDISASVDDDVFLESPERGRRVEHASCSQFIPSESVSSPSPTDYSAPRTRRRLRRRRNRTVTTSMKAAPSCNDARSSYRFTTGNEAEGKELNGGDCQNNKLDSSSMESSRDEENSVSESRSFHHNDGHPCADEKKHFQGHPFQDNSNEKGAKGLNVYGMATKERRSRDREVDSKENSTSVATTASLSEKELEVKEEDESLIEEIDPDVLEPPQTINDSHQVGRHLQNKYHPRQASIKLILSNIADLVEEEGKSMQKRKRLDAGPDGTENTILEGIATAYVALTRIVLEVQTEDRSSSEALHCASLSYGVDKCSYDMMASLLCFCQSRHSQGQVGQGHKKQIKTMVSTCLSFFVAAATGRPLCTVADVITASCANTVKTALPLAFRRSLAHPSIVAMLIELVICPGDFSLLQGARPSFLNNHKDSSFERDDPDLLNSRAALCLTLISGAEVVCEAFQASEQGKRVLRDALLTASSRVHRLHCYPLQILLFRFLISVRGAFATSACEESSASEDSSDVARSFVKDLDCSFDVTVQDHLGKIEFGVGSQAYSYEHPDFMKWIRKVLKTPQQNESITSSVDIESHNYAKRDRLRCCSFQCNGVYSPSPLTGEIGTRIGGDVAWIDVNAFDLSFYASCRSVAGQATDATVEDGIILVRLPLEVNEALTVYYSMDKCSVIFHMSPGAWVRSNMVRLALSSALSARGDNKKFSLFPSPSDGMDGEERVTDREVHARKKECMVQFFVKRTEFKAFLRALRSRKIVLSSVTDSSPSGDCSANEDCAADEISDEITSPFGSSKRNSFRKQDGFPPDERLNPLLDNAVELNTKFLWHSPSDQCSRNETCAVDEISSHDGSSQKSSFRKQDGLAPDKKQNPSQDNALELNTKFLWHMGGSAVSPTSTTDAETLEDEEPMMANGNIQYECITSERKTRRRELTNSKTASYEIIEKEIDGKNQKQSNEDLELSSRHQSVTSAVIGKESSDEKSLGGSSRGNHSFKPDTKASCSKALDSGKEQKFEDETEVLPRKQLGTQQPSRVTPLQGNSSRSHQPGSGKKPPSIPPLVQEMGETAKHAKENKNKGKENSVNKHTRDKAAITKTRAYREEDSLKLEDRCHMSLEAVFALAAKYNLPSNSDRSESDIVPPCKDKHHSCLCSVSDECFARANYGTEAPGTSFRPYILDALASESQNDVVRKTREMEFALAQVARLMNILKERASHLISNGRDSKISQDIVGSCKRLLSLQDKFQLEADMWASRRVKVEGALVSFMKTSTEQSVLNKFSN